MAKIVLAPNAFKGTLTAAEVAAAMAEGVRAARPDAEIVSLPLSDGGDGFLDVVLAARGGERFRTCVTDPLGREIEAEFAIVPALDAAVVESALASGLALLRPDERDPMVATSRGTGELIRAALAHRPRHLLVGLGGSATVDGGVGAAAALGLRFLDASGEEIADGGGALAGIRAIRYAGRDPALKGVKIAALCDVANPLLGPEGAARVYGPQKGATPDQVERLEAGLSHLADGIQSKLLIDVREVEGAGAAGGLGAGLLGFLGARLLPGGVAVLELVGLHEHLADADLVLTGEGRIDAQTGFGKVPVAVAMTCADAGVPCVAIAGSVAEGHEMLLDHGLSEIVPLCRGGVTEEEAMARGPELLAAATREVIEKRLA